MDFLPIIPLNENESDSTDNIDIPEELALLPLRNTVLFPGVVLPITVGRDKSIKAVTDAYKANKLVGVIAQKDSSIEDPAFKDLEQVGTVARIVKQIKMPDGGTTIIIQGKTRFRIHSLVTEEPYFKAKIEVLEESDSPKEPDFEAYVANIKDLATEIIQLSPNIPTVRFFLFWYQMAFGNFNFLLNSISIQFDDLKTIPQSRMHILQIICRSNK